MNLKHLPIEIKFLIAIGMYWFKNYMSTHNIEYLENYAEVKCSLIKRGYDILPLDI